MTNPALALLTKYRIEALLVLAGLLILVVVFGVEWQVLHASDTNLLHGHVPNNVVYAHVPAAPLDDVYIHCRYAENLLKGDGYSFNPGEQLSGDTSPLWVLLVAAGGLVTSHLEVVCVVLSALFYLMLGPGVYRVSRDVFGVGERWSIMAAVATVIGSRLIWSAASGMEVTLAALLVLLAIEEHERAKQRQRPRLREGLWLGLGYAVRPEFLMLTVLIYGDWLQIAMRQKAMDKRVVMSLGLAILLMLPYPIFSYLTSGSFISHSSVVQGAGLGRFDLYYWDYATRIYLSNNFAACLLAAAMIRPLWRDSKWRVAILFVFGLPIVQAFIAPNYRHHGRYLFPVFAVLMIVAAGGAKWLSEKSGKRWVSVAIVALVVIGGGVEVWRWVKIEAEDARNINDQHLAVAAWVKQNLGQSDTLAVDDVGAIGYLTDRRVIDLTGLMTPALWKVEHDQDSVWMLSRRMGANFFIIYNRLNRPFYARHKDSLELVTSFSVRPPLTSSADTTMSLYRIHSAPNALR